MRRITGVDTPSQRWARRNKACIDGRRRLGRQSIFHYFSTCWSLTDMSWVARRLKTLNPEHQQDYERATGRCSQWVAGSSYNVLLRRKALRRIMDAFDVQWPSEIL